MKDVIVLLGMPGSGKSTQADLLCNNKKYMFFGMGDIIRDTLKKKTKVAKQIKDIVNKGELISFEISADLLFTDIKNHKSKKILIDGFPRQLEQAYILDYFLYSKKYKLRAVLYINISKKESYKRLLKRKRKDDSKKVIKNRINVFYKEINPVLQRYEDKKLLIEINGNQSIEYVYSEIIKKLKI
jgi:adenylate kinase